MPRGRSYKLAGAWGFGPFENDSALDWVHAEIEAPIATAIQRRLETPPEDRHEYDDVIAAAALLEALTFREPSPQVQAQPPGRAKRWLPGGYPQKIAFNLNYEAEERHLWSLALGALEPIVNDVAWIATWTEPARKLQDLDELLKSLQVKKKQERR